MIEVVAALAILATLLVGVLVAQGRHHRQVQRARLRIKACQAADNLLTAWHVGHISVPVQATGRVGEDGSFTWRTEALRSRDTDQLGLMVVQLSIWENAAAEESGEGAPLASVELLTNGNSGVMESPQ